MFKIRNKIGNFFALCVGIAFCLFVHAEYRDAKPVAEKGYTKMERMAMEATFAMQYGEMKPLTLKDLEDLQ